MKGISYITDEKNHKKAVVIDLKTIEQHEDEVHDSLMYLSLNFAKMMNV